MNMIIIFSLVTLFSSVLYTMEPSTCVIIVDHNTEQSLRHYINQEPSLISIFGATPRYSCYENYTKTVHQHLNELSAYSQTSKRFKNVIGSVKEFFEAIQKSPGIDACKKFTAQPASNKLIQLFLAAGLEHKKLTENMRILVAKAQQETASIASSEGLSSCPQLVHVLLPSYFTDAPTLQNDPQAKEHVHEFLKEAAYFYKQLYEQLHENNHVQIYILIPRLEDFLHMIKHADSITKLEMNMQLVESSIIAHASHDHGFMLLNQNIPELNESVAYLHNKGITKTGGRDLPIFNAMGKASIIFHPYILKPDTHCDFKNSPVCNKQLAAYLSHILPQEQQ